MQYLPIVMAPLMQAAAIKPEIAIIDCECLPSIPGITNSLLSDIIIYNCTYTHYVDDANVDDVNICHVIIDDVIIDDVIINDVIINDVTVLIL